MESKSSVAPRGRARDRPPHDMLKESFLLLPTARGNPIQLLDVTNNGLICFSLLFPTSSVFVEFLDDSFFKCIFRDFH